MNWVLKLSVSNLAKAGVDSTRVLATLLFCVSFLLVLLSACKYSSSELDPRLHEYLHRGLMH